MRGCGSGSSRVTVTPLPLSVAIADIACRHSNFHSSDLPVTGSDSSQTRSADAAAVLPEWIFCNSVGTEPT